MSAEEAGRRKGLLVRAAPPMPQPAVCDVCVYRCKTWAGGIVTFAQAKDKPCMSIGENGLVNLDQIDPRCK